MGQDFMAIGQGDAEHGSRQDLGDRASQFDWFFFRHGAWLPRNCYLLPCTAFMPSMGGKIKQGLAIKIKQLLPKKALDNPPPESLSCPDIYEEQSHYYRAGHGGMRFGLCGFRAGSRL